MLGPEKLPARTAGQWYAKFRRTVATLQSEITSLTLPKRASKCSLSWKKSAKLKLI
ncbi:MAG: hypothetical protein U1E98_01475 [Moraxella osloensis]